VELASDRRYHFDASPGEVWAALADTAGYRRWWPWVAAFDGDRLAAGDAWRCAVRPPLGYTVRFTIHLDEVVRPTSVAARVAGEIRGDARIELEPCGDGCALRLTSTLAPGNRAFALLAAIARPIVRRGHDWVLDTGARQFAARALGAPSDVARR
jgi:uncharacterized protein YndB with AHSA1/START domain